MLYEVITDGKKKSGDFPEVDEGQKDKKGYWKMYFGEVEEFLIKEVKKLELSKPETAVIEEDEELSSDDLPF